MTEENRPGPVSGSLCSLHLELHPSWLLLRGERLAPAVCLVPDLSLILLCGNFKSTCQ